MNSLPPEALTLIVGLVLLIPTINGVMDIFRKWKGSPPVREELLANYATKAEMERMRIDISHQLNALRTECEARDRGIHKRINEIYDQALSTNRTIGELTGLIRGRSSVQ